MEYVVLAGLLILGLPVVVILAIVTVVGRRQEMRDLHAKVDALDARVAALSRRVREAAPADEAPASGAVHASATPAPARPLAAPVPVPVPVPTSVPAATTAATPLPPTAATTPPPISATIRTPAPPRATPPSSRPTAPAPPPPPPFDWESLLGVKGAAIVGGIAIVIAALLFARYAISQGWITPEMRIAALVGSGLAMLVGAEVSLRRGYETTANAVSGAGIAVLYIGFYAGHALYHLLSMSVTFAMMALVTLVAGLLAVRYDAYVTAVLGLLGGFATPVLLSTGEDHTIGLFSYLLLLNLGLLSIAVRRRWHGLALLALGGTFLMELGWFSRFMSPAKTVVGLVVFLLFGLVYLALSLLGAQDGEDEGAAPALVNGGSLGALAPLLFAMFLAGDQGYAAEWPLLFGFLGLLSLALAAVAIARGRGSLALGGALAVAVTLAEWAGTSAAVESLWGPVLGAIALMTIWNLAARVRQHFFPGARDVSLEWSGLFAAAGAALFALILVARGFGEPAGPILTILAAIVAAVLERTRPRTRLVGIAVLGPAAAAVVAMIWFFAVTRTETLPAHLAVPLLVSVAFSIAAAVRPRQAGAASEDEAGVLGTAAIAFATLLGCLSTTALGGDPVPLLAALAVLTILIVLSAARGGPGTATLAFALLTAAGYMTIWYQAYFEAGDALVVFGFAAGFYLFFLILPFVAPARIAARWHGRRMPWIAAALSGPLFFYVLHRGFLALGGQGIVGLLPIAMAAISLAVVAGVRHTFPPSEPAFRLRYLALFAAVALWFVAIAIPLQLDRQWITIGWALLGAAVFWLYARLPHGGLKTFGAILFALVGARLLLNPEVLHYAQRGTPIVNWLLYTYGVPVLACLLGAAALRAAERTHATATSVPAAVTLLGLVLLFALVNLEIFDYFGHGGFLELTLERRYPRDFARDLTMSVAWGIYGLGLLVVGVWRRVKELRYVSLAFLLLTVAKVFLYDLSNLHGPFQILSFLGLGVSLIVVSLFYQRFVFRRVEVP